MLRIFAIAVLLTACSSDKADKASPSSKGKPTGKVGASDTVHGAITVDGRELPVTGCEVKDGFDGAELRLATAEGVLGVSDDELHWGQADSMGLGVEMDCSSRSKDYFAGKDEHGSFWKGALEFDCKVMNHSIKGELVVSCGKISAEMEAKWADQRKEMEAFAKQFADADGGVAADAK